MPPSAGRFDTDDADKGRFLEILRLTGKLVARRANAIAEAAEPAAARWEAEDAVRGMFHRLGLIRGVAPTRANIATISGLVRSAASVGVTEAEVLRRFRAYACDDGICSKHPQCAECNLNKHCAQYWKPPTIKQLPEEDRPREKLLGKGEQALSDAELLAILIRTGRGGETAVDVGHRLLKQYGGLEGLSKRSANELSRIPGIGPARATQVAAALELARRVGSKRMSAGDKFTSSSQIFEHFHRRLGDLNHEVFICLMLDAKNRVLRESESARGGLEASAVNPRDVFGEAVRETASAVIFVHNHPSGDPTPSKEDIALTRRLREAGQLLGLRVLDHVIVGKDRFYSFADQRML